MLRRINALQPAFFGHVALYHATYSCVPDSLAGNCHNVCPDEFFKQISWYKQHFDIISIDALFKSPSTKGKCAITFDDAYKSVFTQALPILKELNVPATVFVNGCTMSKNIFWRDKIRILINGGHVEQFIKQSKTFCDLHGISQDNFYSATKNPSVNSKTMDALLDDFFKAQAIELNEEDQYCVDERAAIQKNPLISFGNHTYSHYVLSSLSKEDQETEIRSNHDFLESLGAGVSKIFSIPFGGIKTFNADTIKLIKRCGYEGILLSRDRLNTAPSQTMSSAFGLPVLERYMPAETFPGFQKQIFKLGIKAAIKPK